MSAITASTASTASTGTGTTTTDASTPRHVADDRRSAPRLPASTYRRRRAVVGLVSAVTVAVTAVPAVDVLAGPSGAPASAVSGRPAPERSTVVARPGDSLWSIAERFRGEIGVTTYVEALIGLNGGPSIQAGQRIVLP